MKSDRWQKIEQVFHDAPKRKPEERATFLHETCAGDSSLFGDVKALLTSYEQEDSLFEDSASALAAEMFAFPSRALNSFIQADTIYPLTILTEFVFAGSLGSLGIAVTSVNSFAPWSSITTVLSVPATVGVVAVVFRAP